MVAKRYAVARVDHTALQCLSATIARQALGTVLRGHDDWVLGVAGHRTGSGWSLGWLIRPSGGRQLEADVLEQHIA